MLTPIAPAPRLCDMPKTTGNPNYTCRDRNKRALYRCDCGHEDCGGEKIIRCANVRPGHTVSCGTKGDQAFDDYHTQRAANLPKKTLKAIFNDFQRRGLTIHQLGWKYKLTKYICGYAMKAWRLILEAAEAIGGTATATWTKCETMAMYRWSEVKRMAAHDLWLHSFDPEMLAAGYEVIG